MREDSVLYLVDTRGLGSLEELVLGLGDRSGATNIRNNHEIEEGWGSTREPVGKGGLRGGVVTEDG